MEYGFHGFVIEQLKRKILIVSSYSFDVILLALKKPLNLPWNAHQCGSKTVFQLKNSRATTVTCKRQSEPVFVDLLRSPGIDSQHGGPVRQPYLSYHPARLHRQAESIPGLQKRLQIRAQMFGISDWLFIIYSLICKGSVQQERGVKTVTERNVMYSFPRGNFFLNSKNYFLCLKGTQEWEFFWLRFRILCYLIVMLKY